MNGLRNQVNRVVWERPNKVSPSRDRHAHCTFTLYSGIGWWQCIGMSSLGMHVIYSSLSCVPYFNTGLGDCGCEMDWHLNLFNWLEKHACTLHDIARNMFHFFAMLLYVYCSSVSNSHFSYISANNYEVENLSGCTKQQRTYTTNLYKLMDKNSDLRDLSETGAKKKPEKTYCVALYKCVYSRTS